MLKLRKFGVLKMSLFLGLYGVALGLILGVLTTLFSLIGSSLISSDIDLGTFGFMLGIGSMIVFPIFFGVSMFISGLIFTPIINLILKLIKGLNVLIEEETQ